MNNFDFRGIISMLINPITCTFYTLIFSFAYWGAGILSIGMVLFFIILVTIGRLPFLLFFNKDKCKRKYWISITSLIIMFGLQLFQFWASTPTKLTEGIFSSTIAKTLNPINGKILFESGEQEIWLELMKDTTSIDSLLKNKQLSLINKKDIYMSGFPESYYPDWFPKNDDLSKYLIYQYKNPNYDELDIALVSNDSCKIYYYHISY